MIIPNIKRVITEMHPKSQTSFWGAYFCNAYSGKMRSTAPSTQPHKTDIELAGTVEGLYSDAFVISVNS